MSGGHYLHQVPVAVIVLCKQNEVVISSVVLVLELMVIVLRNIDFTTYDGLYLRKLLGYLQKFLHSVHVSMVSDGKCRHAELLGPFEKACN